MNNPPSSDPNDVICGKKALAQAAGYKDPDKFSQLVWRERKGEIKSMQEFRWELTGQEADAWKWKGLLPADLDPDESGTRAFWLMEGKKREHDLAEVTYTQFKRWKLCGYRGAAELFGIAMREQVKWDRLVSIINARLKDCDIPEGPETSTFRTILTGFYESGTLTDIRTMKNEDR